MTEEFLHYLWKFRLYKAELFTTQCGQYLEIINQGIQNTDAGPDFFNAKIKIGNTLWAGNVEIHLKASDWNKHGHQNDPAYNNVILHVVAEHDTEVNTSSGMAVTTWKMPIEIWYIDAYKKLIETQNIIACSKSIDLVSEIEKSGWIERMAIENLESKVKYISELLNNYKNDWDEVLYILMARNFGFSVNGDVFEQLARQTPWKIVLKNRDKIETLEALFLGQAGFLSDSKNDDYTKKLCEEYLFLKQKYILNPQSQHLWKFLRLRPSNFPTIRLVQFAKLVYQNNFSLTNIANETDFNKILELLMVTPSFYWETHFKPSIESPKRCKRLGKSSAELITINTLIPILFTYGKLHGDENLCHKILSWLQSVPPEKNSIISEWKNLNITAVNAMQTQAIIYLFKNYCRHKKCLQCAIGRGVMRKNK